jgi:genome maintenance exonuclease 1
MNKLDFWESKIYDRVLIDGVRHYDIDGLQYPSVTSVTSAFGKDKLDAWKKRIGEEQAQFISNTASENGTYIHHLSEQYLLGNTIDHKNSTVLQKMTFGSFKKLLDRINIIHLLENTLYSHRMKLAGTVDCVGEFDGVLSIIDFKTSKKEKKMEWIENYLVQTCIYAMMIYEMYGIKIHQVVLLFACRDLDTPVVIKKIDKELLNLVKKYINYYVDKKTTISIT